MLELFYALLLSLVELIEKSRRFNFLDNAHVYETFGIGGCGLWITPGKIVKQSFYSVRSR
jgi:hypothetical protein